MEEIKAKSLQSSGESHSCPKHITLGKGYWQEIEENWELGAKWSAECFGHSHAENMDLGKEQSFDRFPGMSCIIHV